MKYQPGQLLVTTMHILCPFSNPNETYAKNSIASVGPGVNVDPGLVLLAIYDPGDLEFATEDIARGWKRFNEHFRFIMVMSTRGPFWINNCAVTDDPKHRRASPSSGGRARK